MESKFNGQTDSHGDVGRAKFRYQVLNIVVIDDFDLHIFNLKIDFVIFSRSSWVEPVLS